MSTARSESEPRLLVNVLDLSGTLYKLVELSGQDHRQVAAAAAFGSETESSKAEIKVESEDFVDAAMTLLTCQLHWDDDGESRHIANMQSLARLRHQSRAEAAAAPFEDRRKEIDQLTAEHIRQKALESAAVRRLLEVAFGDANASITHNDTQKVAATEGLSV